MASFSSDLTRKGNDLHEGKALGNPSVNCGSCKEGISIKHCQDCNQPLCDRCITVHGNLPLLRNHKLIDIREYKPTNPRGSKPKCSKHTNQPLSAICEECLQSLCDNCTDDHKGHKLQYAYFEVSFLQNVSAQKVPGLMQIAQKLDKLKDGSSQKLELYKEAKRLVIEWKNHLLQIITDDTDQLLHDIDAEITKQEILSNTIKSKINHCSSNADDVMTMLGNARKISDSSVLLSNINECDQIMEIAKNLIASLESMTTSYTTDDLFPYRKQQQNIAGKLHEYFSMIPLQESSTSNVLTANIPDTAIGSVAPKSMATRSRPVFSGGRRLVADRYIGKSTELKFRISKNNDSNTKAAMIYDYKGTDVYEFDIDKDTIRSHICDRRIHRMCTLSSGKHVIRENSTGDIHVMNQHCKTIATMKWNKPTNKYKPWTLCHKNGDIFFMMGIFGNSKTRLSEVTVGSDNTFTVNVLHDLDVLNKNSLVSLHPDMEYIIMSTGTSSVCQSLCFANLKSGLLTQVDLNCPLKKAQIFSIQVDLDGTVLVGDSSGYVHKVTNMKYDGQVSALKQANSITGIKIIEDKLIIVSGENLYVYK